MKIAGVFQMVEGRASFIQMSGPLVGLALALSSWACSPVGFNNTPSTQNQVTSVDPGQPIEVHYPTIGSNIAAVAFEDSYPKAGDADFNDFLTNFRVTEKLNTANQITDIILDFYPRAIGASYDHSFLLIVNGQKDLPSNINLKTSPLFVGAADISLTHYSAAGDVIDTQNGLDPQHDLVIFKSTHAAFHATKTTQVINTYVKNSYVAPDTAQLIIHLRNPEMNPLGARSTVDASKVRMVLHVKDTNQDIDTVDINPINLDSKGFPFGMIIPSNWRWPTEDTSITTVYPNFALYQAYLLARSLNPKMTAIDSTLNWFTTLTDVAGTGLYPAIAVPPLRPVD